MTIPAAPERHPAVIRANIVIEDGQIVSIGGIPGGDAWRLGRDAADPAARSDEHSRRPWLRHINIKAQPDGLHIAAGGEEVLSIAYDATSLGGLWGLLKPLAGATLADNPGLTQLIEQMILPMLTTSDVDVTLTLQ